MSRFVESCWTVVWMLVVFGVVLGFDDMLAGQCPDCDNREASYAWCTYGTSCSGLRYDFCDGPGQRWPLPGYFQKIPSICYDVSEGDPWDDAALCYQVYNCYWDDFPFFPYCYYSGFDVDWEWVTQFVTWDCEDCAEEKKK